MAMIAQEMNEPAEVLHDIARDPWFKERNGKVAIA